MRKRTLRRIIGTMKTKCRLWLLVIGGAIVLTACGTRKLTVVDKIFLNDSAMRFDHTGAELAECTLVSQLERGRSSGTNAGGAG